MNDPAEETKRFAQGGELHLEWVGIAEGFVAFNQTSAETQLFDGRSNAAIHPRFKVNVHPNEFTSFIN
jgi:hypothetical protein